MKNLKTMILTLFVSITTIAYAQNDNTVKTETIAVSGNCEMCKKRIDKAAMITGVKKADWNIDSKMLKITYNTVITNIDFVRKAIAAKGYDTDKIKANDKSYADLPECCQYKRAK
jgi:mercuric ion binding protein